MVIPVHDEAQVPPVQATNDTSVHHRSHSGVNITGIALLAAAGFQIIGAVLPAVFNWGIAVNERSFQAQHPLVPEGAAFSIWSLIYLLGLVSGIWAVLPSNHRTQRFGFAILCLSLIFVMNGLWSLWVPFRGFDPVSIMIIAVSVVAGISALMRLRHQVLDVKDVIFIALPMALVTGWVSAALTVNITSALVETGFVAFDPRVPMNSGLVLIALVLFAMAVIWFTRNRIYALPVIWALFWIITAAVNRDQLPLMAALAGIGIGFILVELVVVSFRKRKAPPEAIEAQGV